MRVCPGIRNARFRPWACLWPMGHRRKHKQGHKDNLHRLLWVCEFFDGRDREGSLPDTEMEPCFRSQEWAAQSHWFWLLGLQT